ncbi:MAG: glycosyltransferase family 2 protein [Candidatus Sulfotelmatobacter sp.]
MSVSVIICTYNRCDILETALSSVMASALPESTEWEVVVVDNNSCDHTREVVEGFCRRYPGRVRYLFEQQPGKSYALNTGVCEARGDILAFMDDDLTVEPTWLQSLTVAMNDGQWAGVGGRTLLAQAFSPPSWLTLDGPYSLGAVLAALFDLGDNPCQLTEAPYGANMAYQKKMFEKYGLFRTDLGPSPTREIPRPNEDTEFGRRLLAGGERLRYEPLAIAYHPLPEDRIRQDYFLDWHFDFGRAIVREFGRGPNVLGIPRPWLKMLAIWIKTIVLTVPRWIVSLSPHRRFHWKCMVWVSAGGISELYRFTRYNLHIVRHPDS